MVESDPGPDTLIGGDGNDLLFARDGDDWMYGGNGNDRLESGQGDDRLSDGAGADTLVGGEGNDRILMAADGATDVVGWDSIAEGGDLISGFQPGLDKLRLLAALESRDWISGVAPIAVSARDLLYDTATGRLSIDMDGSGGDAPVLLATFIGRPTLSYLDLI
jgi:Ca2+-binding RTX toxin-like protein